MKNGWIYVDSCAELQAYRTWLHWLQITFFSALWFIWPFSCLTGNVWIKATSNFTPLASTLFRSHEQQHLTPGRTYVSLHQLRSIIYQNEHREAVINGMTRPERGRVDGFSNPSLPLVLVKSHSISQCVINNVDLVNMSHPCFKNCVPSCRKAFNYGEAVIKTFFECQ